MANMLDYLTWRGDLTFAERPLNEVDNLILSELAYDRLDGVVPAPGEGSLPLPEVCRGCDAAGQGGGFFRNDPRPLLRKAAASPRFAEVLVSDFVNEVNNEAHIQFCAVTFTLPGGARFIAYRGTDDSIVGWREDFNFSFLEETPGQSQAVRYLNAAAGETAPLYVGGHSKGGNLAMYAAAFCDPAVKARIRAVYSNDGPGFNSTVTDTPEYRAILPVARQIIPEASLIGILLSTQAERTVIRSSAEGIQQHNPNTWEVEGTAFVPAAQRDSSQMAGETVELWLSRLTPQERENLTSAIFDTLDSAGVDTLPELGANPWASYNAMMRSLLEMDADRRSEVLGTWKKLAASTGEVVKEEMQSRLNRLRRQIAAKTGIGAPAEEQAGDA